MSRLALMIDLERCIGCKSCEVACKQEHGLGPGEYRNKVVWLGDPEKPALDFLTVSCQHCDRPACLRACPVNPKAITKDPVTGIARVDEDRCTGCGECVIACPYGAMGYDAVDHHAVKCDLCTDRREKGAPTTACASVCPGHAITFGERAEMVAAAEADGRTVRDHDHFLLAPANVYLDRLPRENGIGNSDTLAARKPPAFMDADFAGLPWTPPSDAAAFGDDIADEIDEAFATIDDHCRLTAEGIAAVRHLRAEFDDATDRWRRLRARDRFAVSIG